jgi:hypothetical protein
MSTITVPVQDEDLAFLRAWSKEHGTSPEALLGEQARNLRELLEEPLGADVVAATGIVSPDVDVEKAYYEYLEKKYS